MRDVYARRRGIPAELVHVVGAAGEVLGDAAANVRQIFVERFRNGGGIEVFQNFGREGFGLGRELRRARTLKIAIT